MLRFTCTRRFLAGAPIALALTFLWGCELPRAYGDANALIVAVHPTLWAEVEGVFRDAIEPTIQTVRNERPYRITPQDPTDTQDWNSLRRFQQVIVLGDENDVWVQEALDRYRNGSPPAAPALIQVENVWARGQLVSILLLPEEGQAGAVAQLGPELRTVLDERFRRYALSRMFVSGQNVALADSLAENVGFALTFPQVYRYSVRDSVFRFRNDNPSPQDLIREIAVTWVTPIPEDLPTRPELESWRVEFSEREYNDAQLLDTMIVSYRDVEVSGLTGVEFQSAWMSPPDAWPAGGPFITRAIRCPAQDRMYLMDAWLYAPERDKYEYMIQLQTILNSFDCT